MSQKIAILGASGYTGAELVRLIATHPTMEIVALSGDRKAGMAMGDVFPHLRHMSLPALQKKSKRLISRTSISRSARCPMRPRRR